MGASRWSRSMHRLHRGVGSACALLLAVWFASGAVMTFSGYPRLTERERLELAPPLPRDAPVELPPALASELGRVLGDGARARLAMHEGTPTWLYTNAQSERVATRAAPPVGVSLLDQERARREAERRFALPAVEVQLLSQPDQWTVALVKPEILPIYRVKFDDPRHTEAYVSSRTGELLQASTRRERALAWVGAIPHWIYPTILRRERDLWRYSVLALSAVGLVVTLSGTVIGVHVWRATRKRRAPRDAYLRWHQALGLCFGLFATTWLFSGALSLSPFQWSGRRQTSERERAALYDTRGVALATSPAEALRRCQAQIEVRELELVALAQKFYAVCSGASGTSRLVDLTDARAEAKLAATPDLKLLAQRLAREHGGSRMETARDYDDYYYPTHSSPDTAALHVRISLSDRAQTVYYLDPARMRLLRTHTRATRLERWLYHGLHSLDFRWLYRHRTLWLAIVNTAMAIGFILSGLGGLMWLRRTLRAGRSKQRALARAAGALDAHRQPTSAARLRGE